MEVFDEIDDRVYALPDELKVKIGAFAYGRCSHPWDDYGLNQCLSFLCDGHVHIYDRVYEADPEGLALLYEAERDWKETRDEWDRLNFLGLMHD